MRVIAGVAKGRTLQAVPGESTRPITDRVKSAVFSILQSQEMIEGRRFLDLFGGTGAVGIEALSRGAAAAVFCERDRAALRVLQHNLQTTGLAERAQVVAGDAFGFLERATGSPFDVIYVAPPQYQGLWLKALRTIDARPELLAAGGEVIVQVFPKEWEEPGLRHLALADQRRYGSTALYFFDETPPDGERPRDPSSTPCAAPAPPLDEATLAGLWELQGNGEPDGITQVLEMYLGSMPGRLADLRTAVANGDAVRLVQVAHSIRGSSATLGARGLADLCRDLEVLGGTGTVAGAASGVMKVEAEFERVRCALDEELRRMR